jgi:hypothetical protein
VHLRSIQLCLIAVVCLPALAWGGTIDVTCGDTVSYRHARLIGDCTGSITVVSGKLDLEGHTISGTGLAAVQCVGGCRVTGPGAIVSAGSIFGISGDDRIRATDVTIRGTTRRASAAARSESGHRFHRREQRRGIRGTRIRVRGSKIRNNAGSGIGHDPRRERQGIGHSGQRRRRDRDRAERRFRQRRQDFLLACAP